MELELGLIDFIETAVATPEQWRKYQELGTDSLYDPSYRTKSKDPASRRTVPSLPSGRWYERDEIYKTWIETTKSRLRSGEWIALAKVGGSTKFEPIEFSAISILHLKLHENHFSIDGRTYSRILFRKAPEVSEEKRLIEFIETVCRTLSPKNITKPDVFKLAQAQLEFSINKPIFEHAWQVATIDKAYRKKGPRNNKEASRNRDDA